MKSVLAAILFLSISAPALAQPPNDTYLHRTLLDSNNLPFGESLNTSQATSDIDDVELNILCGAPATDASVWYEFTATGDAQVSIDAEATSGFSVGIILATGSPGAFNFLTCGQGSLQFPASAGETYVILAFDDGTDGGGNGGDLEIQITQSTEAAELLARIRAVPGVASATQGPNQIPGTFSYQIEFRQPVNHKRPKGATFLQRVVLLHRSTGGPMVLELEGYYAPPFAVQRELTFYLQANQLSVEHRFFPPSTPNPRNWKDLTIAQSAADHHRIVAAFKKIYTGKWVSTGSSKGGMAAVYHRYFYPADVTATVPYVAPSSHSPRDTRYIPFLEQLGTRSCRTKLLNFQQASLARRAELLALMPSQGFDILGQDRALEFAIVETPFAFWQYSRFFSCDAIPSPHATGEELFGFLDFVTTISTYSDSSLEAFAPYYYQAATELGSPRFDERGLRRLLNYPREDVPENYPPLGVEKDFERGLMRQVEQWVKTSGRRMLFLYGANDPWSATAFDVETRNDSYRFVLGGPSGDHLAQLDDLSPAKFEFALAKLQSWLGITPTAAQRTLTLIAPRIDRPTRRELFLR